MTNTPLNPEALEASAAAARIYWSGHTGWNGAPNSVQIEYRNLARAAVTAYLAVAQPVVNSMEELDALPQETVIRSVLFGIVRERLDSGWLATGGEELDDSDTIAGRDHIVLYRPEVKP